MGNSNLLTQITFEETKNLEAIHKQAYTDYLTGLYNRHMLDELANKQAFKQAILILIDLDYLKTINDTYGHTTGDNAVVGIANKIREVFKDINQHAFRIGGDEFLIVCPDSNHKLAYEQAEKLLDFCKKPIQCTHTKKKIKLGASIGISEYRQDEAEFHQALA
ncbi:MAG: GGDEF domain-containing protein, partial [Culicoidibacterales bacterium]